MDGVGILGATRQTWRHGKTIRDILVEVIEAYPHAGEGALFREFLDRCRNEEECLVAAVRYAFDNSYRTLLSQKEREAKSKPPNVEQRVKTARANLARAEEYAETVKSIKHQVMLLNLPMPNGKLMRNCTGEEMGGFGKTYIKIARKVGFKKVGEVLTEDQLHELLD